MLVTPVKFFVMVVNSKLNPGLSGLGSDSDIPPSGSDDSVPRLESECDKACEFEACKDDHTTILESIPKAFLLGFNYFFCTRVLNIRRTSGCCFGGEMGGFLLQRNQS